MQRPRVVMGVSASVDGKVTLTRQQILMQQPSGRLWADMVPPDADPLQEDFFELVRQRYGCNATLEGSGSLVVDGDEPPPLPPYESDPAELYTDFLPPEVTDQPSPPHMWFTVVDGRGADPLDRKASGLGRAGARLPVYARRLSRLSATGAHRLSAGRPRSGGSDRGPGGDGDPAGCPLRAVDGRRRPERGTAPPS